MAHPDHIVPEEELATIQIVEPVYPLTAGLPPKVLRKAIEAALERAARAAGMDRCRASSSARHGPAGCEALRAAHHPQGEADLSTLIAAAHAARL